MSLSGIYGVPPQIMNNVYRCTNKEDGRYTLQGPKVEQEIQALEKKLEDGQISEGEYNQKKSILKNIPDTIFSDNGKVQFTPLEKSKKGSEHTESADKVRERQFLRDLFRLESQKEAGEISDFAYRANKFLMTNPFIQSPNEPGMKFSTTA